MRTEEDTGQAAIAKRCAILGLALPYAVSLLLVLACASIVGHAGNTATAEEWDSCEHLVAIATWLAVALSVPLTLPFFIGRVKRSTRTSSGLRPNALTYGRLALAYAALIAANAVLGFFAFAVAWMVAVGGR